MEKLLEDFNPDDFVEDDGALEEGGYDEEGYEEEYEEEYGDESNQGLLTEKEEKLYKKEEVSRAVQSRVKSLNKKIDKLKAYETAVKKMTSVTGLDFDTLTARLNNLPDSVQARLLNVTPQQLALHKAQTEKTDKALREAQELKFQLEEEKLKADPKYRDYDLFKDDIADIMEDNPKLSIRQAYILAKGETAISAVARDAEQRAIAKSMKSSNQRVVVSGGNAGTQTASKIDPSMLAAAKKIGMNPAEYAAYSNISSLEDYDKYKASTRRKKK
jgi:hypothetical protein